MSSDILRSWGALPWMEPRGFRRDSLVNNVCGFCELADTGRSYLELSIKLHPSFQPLMELLTGMYDVEVRVPSPDVRY